MEKCLKPKLGRQIVGFVLDLLHSVIRICFGFRICHCRSCPPSCIPHPPLPSRTDRAQHLARRVASELFGVGGNRLEVTAENFQGVLFPVDFASACRGLNQVGIDPKGHRPSRARLSERAAPHPSGGHFRSRAGHSGHWRRFTVKSG
jgi:hypothetical protein